MTTNSVFQALKAACNEAVAVLVSQTGQTAAIWDRLLAAVVVAPTAQDGSAVGQYDISYQLAEIEVGPTKALLFMVAISSPVRHFQPIGLRSKQRQVCIIGCSQLPGNRHEDCLCSASRVLGTAMGL